jgi:hypothetical protein
MEDDDFLSFLSGMNPRKRRYERESSVHRVKEIAKSFFPQGRDMSSVACMKAYAFKLENLANACNNQKISAENQGRLKKLFNSQSVDYKPEIINTASELLKHSDNVLINPAESEIMGIGYFSLKPLFLLSKTVLAEMSTRTYGNDLSLLSLLNEAYTNVMKKVNDITTNDSNSDYKDNPGNLWELFEKKRSERVFDSVEKEILKEYLPIFELGGTLLKELTSYVEKELEAGEITRQSVFNAINGFTSTYKRGESPLEEHVTTFMNSCVIDDCASCSEHVGNIKDCVNESFEKAVSFNKDVGVLSFQALDYFAQIIDGMSDEDFGKIKNIVYKHLMSDFIK